MGNPNKLEVAFLAGTVSLLASHAKSVPQKDDLCGAFCATLALHAAGFHEDGAGGPLDQDAVAVAAGSVVGATRDSSSLPAGESGRRDYRLELPTIEDSKVSGTPASGVVRAIEELARGRLTVLAYPGPWTVEALDGLFDAAAALSSPVSLIANFATRHLWGGRPSVGQLLGYALEGTTDGPPADWDVGHFGCVIGAMRGPTGSLYTVVDTYRGLGNEGVHLQPAERLVDALNRPDLPSGGMIVVVSADDADAIVAATDGLGLERGTWDNGSVTQGMAI